MAYFLNKLRERQDGVADLCLITGEITDAAITNQLGVRLTKGLIHTSVSEVLIICNPYQTLPIYGPSHIALYQTANMSDTEPHIYGLAERAYRKMATTRVPQAVIISGESGAGKTESAKLILHYASSVSGSSPLAQRVKAIVLDSNPLLESFGNAKTTRNNNSSRFGKYLTLDFNERAEPCGGFTTNFLLEKTRVTFQQQGERNFHIFYQMLLGAWPELLQACRMGPADNFAYLSKSGTFEVQGVDDARNFREVCWPSF
jgi:myosin-1